MRKNEKFVAYTPCLKCLIQNKQTELRILDVGIGSLACIIYLLIVPVANILMGLGCQSKGTKDFSGQSDFL